MGRTGQSPGEDHRLAQHQRNCGPHTPPVPVSAGRQIQRIRQHRRSRQFLLSSTVASLTRNARLLFLTRFVRLFAYGSLSVVLVLYLSSLGLSTSQTGILLTMTLLGDTAVSLALTTQADRFGRRRTLVIGAILMATAGVVFATTSSLWLLFLAGTIGVISPSGNEVGPFLPVE